MGDARVRIHRAAVGPDSPDGGAFHLRLAGDAATCPVP